MSSYGLPTQVRDGFFTRMRATVETLVATTGHRAVLTAHSYGENVVRGGRGCSCGCGCSCGRGHVADWFADWVTEGRVPYRTASAGAGSVSRGHDPVGSSVVLLPQSGTAPLWRSSTTGVAPLALAFFPHQAQPSFGRTASSPPENRVGPSAWPGCPARLLLERLPQRIMRDQRVSGSVSTTTPLLTAQSQFRSHHTAQPTPGSRLPDVGRRLLPRLGGGPRGGHGQHRGHQPGGAQGRVGTAVGWVQQSE